MRDPMISVRAAAAQIDNPTWRFFDVRYTLGDSGKGARDYAAGHLPGAAFADLDTQLAAPHQPGRTGRHPLPARAAFVQTLSRWAIVPGQTVVVYDESVGQLAAGRLWWMLQWVGHADVFVLDGGFARWRAEGLPVSTTPAAPRPPRRFIPAWRDDLLADAGDVQAALANRSAVVLDARAAERYRGDVEAIDPVAGHIPGALSAPLTENIVEGVMDAPATLARRFERLVPQGSEAIFYCGSGVSATQNILAYARAGRGLGRLYAGSWSDWITDPDRPTAKGSA